MLCCSSVIFYCILLSSGTWMILNKWICVRFNPCLEICANAYALLQDGRRIWKKITRARQYGGLHKITWYFQTLLDSRSIDIELYRSIYDVVWRPSVCRRYGQNCFPRIYNLWFMIRVRVTWPRRIMGQNYNDDSELHFWEVRHMTDSQEFDRSKWLSLQHWEKSTGGNVTERPVWPMIALTAKSWHKYEEWSVWLGS